MELFDEGRPRVFVGGDPGSSGGIAAVGDNDFVRSWKSPDTQVDFLGLARTIANDFTIAVAAMEKVHAMPKQGVVSVFSFGRNYERMQMAMLAAGIGFIDVNPKKWQTFFGLYRVKDEASSAWKNRLKAKAQQLYPLHKVTLWNADAILIARFMRDNS